MKKLLITLFIIPFIVCGCVEVSNKSVSDVFETILYQDNNLSNVYMDGYSIYIPHGLTIIDKSDYNLIIQDNKIIYYLYIDTIAHHYNIENSFVEKSNHFYSKKFSYGNKIGYVDIIENKDNYFVVIMYNYAKIESYIPKSEFDIALINISSILSSVKYNDIVINKKIGDNGTVFKEERFNLFDSTTSTDDNFLKYESEYGTYKDEIKINLDDDIINIDNDEIIE